MPPLLNLQPLRLRVFPCCVSFDFLPGRQFVRLQPPLPPQRIVVVPDWAAWRGSMSAVASLVGHHRVMQSNWL